MSNFCFLNRFSQLLSGLKIGIVSMLVGSILNFTCLVDNAHAVESIVLAYRDNRVSISESEFTTFADGAELSERLQRFIQNIPLSPEQTYTLLNEPIIPGFTLKLDRNLTEFVSIQLSKLIGDPYGREPIDSVQASFAKALADDRQFSIRELVSDYPDPEVRVDLSRLNQVYSDINLFVERVSPILQSIDTVLVDLVCDCENEPSGPALLTPSQPNLPDPLQPADAPRSNQTLNKAMGFAAASPQSVAVPVQYRSAGQPIASRFSNPRSPVQPFLAQASSDTLGSESKTYLAKEVVFTYGPLGRSIPIEELTTLAETGQASRRIRSLLGLVKVSPDALRAILIKEATVNPIALDKILNSILGEFALFEMGQVIRTGSGTSTIQALRSALVLSAQTDRKISLMEFLQNYPLPQVYLVGTKIAGLARIASNRTRTAEFAISQVESLEDFLVSFQAAIASELCTCNQESPPTD